MEKKFVYVFTVGGKLMYSNDTPTNIITHGDNIADTTKICKFVSNSKSGDFMILSTGEMIFCT